MRSGFDICYQLLCWALILSDVDPVVIVMTPAELFIKAALIAMAAGLSALFRSKSHLNVRNITANVLSMATCGASLAMVGYATYQPENLAQYYYIIGIVGIVSLPGFKTIEVVRELTGKLVDMVFGRFLPLEKGPDDAR